MKVSVSESEPKRKYEYKTITVEGIDKGWHIHRVWSTGAEVSLYEGKLKVVIRRALPDGF